MALRLQATEYYERRETSFWSPARFRGCFPLNAPSNNCTLSVGATAADRFGCLRRGHAVECRIHVEVVATFTAPYREVIYILNSNLWPWEPNPVDWNLTMLPTMQVIAAPHTVNCYWLELVPNKDVHVHVRLNSPAMSTGIQGLVISLSYTAASTILTPPA